MSANPRRLTRRHVLRGAGVALALPWLESLEPRRARGQQATRPLRFVPVYFPMGTAPFWTPKGTGTAFELSPILEPLAPLKSQVTVLSHVANTAYAATDPAPTFARETGSFLTCTAAGVPSPAMPAWNSRSVDQVLQLYRRPAGYSMQLGLSTLEAASEDLPPGFAGSVSWVGSSAPLFKWVDPQAVFDQIVRVNPFLVPRDAATARRATNKSVLDFVRDDASSWQARLGPSDRLRLDRFMSSVRSVEQRVVMPVGPACAPIGRPATGVDVGKVPPGYDRDAHADVMIDLLVMALGCDITNVASFMLDDGGSDFVYDFLTARAFTEAGSTAGTARVGAYRAVATGGAATSDAYATINRWFVSKVARLCGKLAELPDGDGKTVLDNSLVWFGSGMHDGQSRSPADLPLLYVGSGGGALKVGAHIDLQGTRRLSDLYETFLKKVFGVGGMPFGDSHGVAPEILA